jgi:putative DNA primase/helicase
LVLLQDLLTEFPFVTEVDRAVALSAMITSVVRSCMENVPMHAFRASTAGSGKSYLCDIVSALCIGRFCPAASTGTDMKEFESCLNGMLLAGHSIFSLDNINGDLGGDLLCRALTQRSLLLRMLGSSKMHETETQTTILANGNAITVVGDAIRRVLMANLDPKMERPELREFDKRPYDMVIGDRSKYVSACLTIVRAYILAERPKCLSPKLASFEGWSDNVRSALVWLGCADPVASMDQAREDDPVLGQLREFIALWPASLGDTCGHTVADLIKAAEGRAKEEEGGVMLNPDWRACLMRIAGKPGGIDATALGKWLGSKAGRVVGEVRIAKSGSNASGGVRRWLLETIPPLAA